MTQNAAMMHTTTGTRRGLRAVPSGFGTLWKAFVRRRQRRRSMASVEHLDDVRLRDIGLPPRGTPVRQIHSIW